MTKNAIAVLLLPALLLVVAARQADAQANTVWVVVGATGMPDESSRDIIKFDSLGGVMLNRHARPEERALLRYALPVRGDIYGLLAGGFCMDLSFLDTGDDARVLVEIKEAVPLSSGRTLMSFDSAGWDGPADAQYRGATTCMDTPDPNAGYMVEVTLMRARRGGQAGFHSMRVYGFGRLAFPEY